MTVHKIYVMFFFSIIVIFHTNNFLVAFFLSHTFLFSLLFVFKIVNKRVMTSLVEEPARETDSKLGF